MKFLLILLITILFSFSLISSQNCEACKRIYDTCRNNSILTTQRCGCILALGTCFGSNGCLESAAERTNLFNFCTNQGCQACDALRLINLRPECPLLKPCVGDATPTKIFDGCFSCRPADTCTPNDYLGCASQLNTRPVCSSASDLTKVNCCPSCRPPVCASSCPDFASLPDCSFDSIRVDRNTCCRTCKVPEPSADRPDNAGKCTKEQFKNCMDRKEFCTTGEDVRKAFDPAACCFGCKRPETRCDVQDVAKCIKNRPECDNNETAAIFENDCCPSCRPRRPVCSSSCSDDQICMRTPNGPQCIKKFRIIKLLRSVTDRPGFLDSTDEEITATLREFVKRWCDRSERKVRCEKFKNIFDDFVAKVLRKVGQDLEIEIDAGEDAVTFFESGEGQDALSSAIDEQSSEEGYKVEEGNNPNSVGKIAISLVSILIVLVNLF